MELKQTILIVLYYQHEYADIAPDVIVREEDLLKVPLGMSP